MQSAIDELNKQIADLDEQIIEAKKDKEESGIIKDLEDQKAILQKQVEMMGRVTKGILKVSDKTFQQAVADDNNKEVAKKDVARIKQLPDKILTDAELVPYVKKIHSEVEKILNAKDKAEALKIYTALKSEKKSSNDINNTASSL